MAIRRFREHVSAHNWFAVSVDVGIVVLGVFLGIQASNWNEGRQTRSVAAEYRSQIVSDLDNNITDLTARQAYYGEALERSLDTLNLLDAQPSAETDKRLVASAYQASEVFARPLVRGAYDEMTASGIGREIADLSTRARLTSLYTALVSADRTFQATTDYREKARRIIPSAVQQYLRRQCADIITRHPNGLRTAAMFDDCRLNLDAAQVRSAAERLRGSSDIKEDLNRHIADLEQKQLLFSGILRLTREVRGDLAGSK
jgi:hypothetical protein